MELIKIFPIKPYSSTIRVPGDKSISHRAAIFLSLAEGTSRVQGFLCSEDCLSTLACLQHMGIPVEGSGEENIIIHGRGGKLIPPTEILNLNNSGTGFRLLCGLLAAQPFVTRLTGDESLCKRPMLRIVEPLMQMGAELHGQGEKHTPPLVIEGSTLKGITYHCPIASAQVKSSILIASLFAKGKTIYSEPKQSRDHTERMLKYLGAQFTKKGLTLEIEGEQKLQAKDILIPGDISSAAFFMALTLMKKGAQLTITDVGLNPTRTGILEIFKRMGGKIEIKEKTGDSYFEPLGDITIYHSELKGIEIGGSIIPNIIDEIPIIALTAAKAKGTTIIKDAKELRVKESDRISTIVKNFKKIGIKIEEKEDGFIIKGENSFNKAQVDSEGDHRIAMTMTIAGMLSEEYIDVQNVDCIDTSFPKFFKTIKDIAE